MSLLMKKILSNLKSLNSKNVITINQEYETGRIVNGKKEYAKLFEVEALTSTAGNTVIPTNLTNITPVKLEGCIKSATLMSNLPFVYTGQSSVYHYCNASGSSIIIRATGDMSKYRATETLYYTKN